jgi:hypothetical protein
MNVTTIKIQGLTPLIMHNGQLADPLNAHTQALAKLTSKRKKTVEDHMALSKCEWEGSLYLDEKGHPCIPGEVLESCLVDGAKKYKLGKACKGALIIDGNFKLEYSGPKTVKALWSDGGFLKRAGVRVGMARVIRSRPIFAGWSLTFDVQWDPGLIQDEAQLLEIADAAGTKGLCDWRPKFGRFEVLN